ncbi:Protein kinase domain family protein [Clavispora lusitaniae]|uniref:Protein kinase C-like 1 n=1 Tax=Clavispora lusitaniae (strain ATCC 42720) TaxID=306902 RepID=C4Y6V6_CLAL4|nr:uncharacterized protein CLUG_03890 [Clavispora lusitaniae ATCC 42720]EEQ39762.1 hypothetical protein CLUG_03890 [Clavispora lusitaniae ATCC 42720]KAF7582267.1 Protein kinase domain family protein [Clavispora lusitaniae]
MSQSKDKVLADIRGKIERENKLIQGFQAVRKNTSNQEVIQRCNNQIRETQTNIEYLRDTLDKLSMQQDTVETSGDERQRHRGSSVSKPLYSRFDLIKYNCPSLGHKIQYMLQQLQFKLQVENQYREANEKISHLYLMDGDKPSSNAAEGGKLDSDYRIQLLNKSLRKYQGMHVNVEEINRDLEIMNIPKFARKSLTGRITINVVCIRDIDHIASPMSHKRAESFVSFKIDDVEKARTSDSRTGKFNEDFVIEVDKAHEMEIAVYDKSNNQRIPVALTWILLSDIAEEIRKKKVANEQVTEGWMPASSISSPSHGSAHANMTSANTPNIEGVMDTASSSSNKSPKNVQISSWVNLEPVGQILINLSFEKSQALGHATFMDALGRHGAIRQKKEEVYEQHGHQFVQKQFYNIMCCALCGEFLRYTGFQCQDCRFLCHKKCYQKVVTKCISTSGTTSNDEAKLNHRIPHRFEPVSNRGTKWCCHCGHILPWGRKNVRKCSECGVMCHSQCTHLVPDFCGMSMEMANKILATIKSTKQAPRIAQQPKSSSSAPEVPPKSASVSPQKPRQTGYETSYSNAQAEFPQTQDPRVRGAYNNVAEYEDETHATKLPTTIRNEFQPAVDSPYTRHATRRPPPQQEVEELMPSQDVDDISTRHDYTFVSNRSDDFEHVPQRTPIDHPQNNPFDIDQEQQTVFDNFDYHNQSSAITQVSSAQENVFMEPPHEAQIRQQEEHHSSHRTHRSKRRRRIGLDDFQFLAVLGKGNFGKVMLAESRTTQKLCAIKVLKKDFIVENEEAESVKTEKRVYLTANKEMHPFLLNLHCCFQTENRIYFVMEYISGGDLMWHIQKSRFSAKRAKFYACEVLLALKYFHDNGIVYRDLKLDNILLTTEGHIKIADYGLCKENMWYKSTTGTFCGTPQFMAPEIIAGKPYDRSVDWWAFGVLMFQMLLCQSPFKGEDEDDIFNAIEHDDVRYPISMPRQTVLVLQALLTKDPAERLGSSERDALDIMEHPYFQDVNFDDVLNRRIQPPYLPELTSEHDYSNFDQEFTSETPRLTPVETVLTSEMQEQFRGFSHIADDAPV